MIVIDFPSAWAQSSDDYLEKGLKLHDQLRHSSLGSTAFAPHAPYTVSDEALKKIRILADELDVPIHMHVHETKHEVDSAFQQFNQRPLQRLHDLGLLSSSFLAVHMTQLSSDEIRLFAQTGAHIVHCPESNLKLASGFCPVAECLAAGINVALGTDGAASNNDLNMLNELRTAAILAKAVANNASAVPAMTALQMATINGAKALSLDHETGSLVVGKAADVIAIDLSHLETQPLYCPLSACVYAVNRQQISDVWIAGKRLLKQGNLTTINVAELMVRIADWQQRLYRIKI
jgi:5-methylthioadenosine/S-adenosylhomocysteine deaminase